MGPSLSFRTLLITSPLAVSQLEHLLVRRAHDLTEPCAYLHFGWLLAGKEDAAGEGQKKQDFSDISKKLEVNTESNPNIGYQRQRPSGMGTGRK